MRGVFIHKIQYIILDVLPISKTNPSKYVRWICEPKHMGWIWLIVLYWNRKNAYTLRFQFQHCLVRLSHRSCDSRPQIVTIQDIVTNSSLNAAQPKNTYKTIFSWRVFEQHGCWQSCLSISNVPESNVLKYTLMVKEKKWSVPTVN